MPLLQINPVTLREQLEAEFAHLSGFHKQLEIKEILAKLTSSITTDAEISVILQEIYEKAHNLRVMGTKGFHNTVIKIYDIIESHMIYIDSEVELIRHNIFKDTPVNTHISPFEGFVTITQVQIDAAPVPADVSEVVIAEQTQVEITDTDITRFVIEQWHIDDVTGYENNEIGDIVTVSIALTV